MSELSTENYQIVRGEHFSRKREPSLSFYCNKFFVNSYVIRQFPNCNYAQILIRTTDKKLLLKPLEKMKKDSFCWVTGKGKRKPAIIYSDIFLGKVYRLMDWDTKNRYVCTGKMTNSGGEDFLLFDLSSSISYPCRQSSVTRRAFYVDTGETPEFGTFLSEYEDSYEIERFHDNMILYIKDKKEERYEHEEKRE